MRAAREGGEFSCNCTYIFNAGLENISLVNKYVLCIYILARNIYLKILTLMLPNKKILLSTLLKNCNKRTVINI